jgi:cytochrome c oxidase cbb3-type subunit 3
MSTFWHIYIIILVTTCIGLCAWILMWTRKIDIKDMAEDGTTGHEYDGIKEYNNPLPRWWITMFWLSIVFAIGYLIAYPGFGRFPGVLGWTSHKEVAADEAAYQKQYGAIYTNFAKVPIEELINDPRAMKIAGKLFANNCAACHGSNAKGGQGFPNLTDNDWLYGGTPERVKETLLKGRNAMMPAWGETLGEDKVRQVAHYVMSLSGKSANPADVAAGQEIFTANCVACHGSDAKGNTMLGAPNLTDAIWLYGGSESAIIKTLTFGRNGHMPAQEQLLGAERVHLLAAYVLSLSKQNQ